MTALVQAPRSLDYHILRTCERLRLRERDFQSLPYSDQLRLLAFNHLRSLEAAAAASPGSAGPL